MIPSSIIDLLPADSIPVIEYALNNHAYVTTAPSGKRDLVDIASLITACVQRMQQAENERPTDAMYQDAKQAEDTAKALLQGHKTTHHKQAYEDAKEHRIQVGGAIIGAESMVRRMSAMICGELEALELREAHQKTEGERVAIVGSRDYPRLEYVAAYVNRLPMNAVIVSGGAKGVDLAAENAAKARRMKTVIFLPDWDKHGKAAGFIRNQDIVNACDRLVAFHFASSKGTAHSIRLAREAGKQVEIYSSDGHTNDAKLLAS